MIVLDDRDMDKAWIQDFISASEGAEYRKHAFFIIVYLLLSIRRRVYLTDIELLEQMPYWNSIDIPADTEVTRVLVRELDAFMKEHGYRYHALKNHGGLYVCSPALPTSLYYGKEMLSGAGLRRIMVAWIRSSYLIGSQYQMTLINKMYRRRYIRNARTFCDRIKKADTSGMSGSVFFEAVGRDGKQWFIKAGACGRSSIANEVKVSRRLEDMSANKKLYLLPVSKYSNEGMAVYPYMKAQSLQDYVSGQKLTRQQLRDLADFLVAAVKDLNECGIRHCDIHPGNIMMTSHSDGSAEYILTDWGCAVIGNRKVSSGLYARVNDMYAGKDFRYDAYELNDAASAEHLLRKFARDSSDAYVLDRIKTLHSLRRCSKCKAVR
jgi:hypothetical protein